MPTLVQTLEGVLLDDSVLNALGSDLTGAASSITSIPAERITTIVSLAGSIVLPRDEDLLGGGAATLPELTRTGLRDPELLWGAITTRFDDLGATISRGVGGAVGDAFAPLQSIGDQGSLDTEALLSRVLTPLRDLIGQLGDSNEMQQLLTLVGTLEGLRSDIEAAPDAIGSMIAERIGNTITELTGPLTGVVDQVGNHVDTLESALSLDPLLTELSAAQSAVTTDFAALVTTLEFSDEPSFAALSASIRTADARLRAFARHADDSLARADGIAGAFDPGKWAARLGSAARNASQSTVQDLFGFLEPWRILLRDAGARLEAVSPALITEPVQSAVGQVTDAVGDFDLDEVSRALDDALNEAAPIVDGISSASLEVQAAFQGLGDSVAGALGQLDLDGVANTLTNQIDAVTPSIAQLESEVTALQGEATTAINDATSALTTLRNDLVEPDGQYRQHLEGFLNRVRDAIPDDIGDTIETVQGQLQGVADRLAAVELDPVFDEVVGQIEEMQAALDEIEVETLSTILKGALAAALAVFKSLDFDEEIENVLTEKFDEGVAFVSEEVIGRLQAELDKVLSFLSVIQPSRLLEGTGIDEAYESMSAELGAFRPSQLLEPVLDAVTDAADKLEATSPGALLAPLVEPLSELDTYLRQTLSPQPVHGQLMGQIDDLDTQLAALDLSALTTDITAAVNRVREQLTSALTVEGLLAPLRPVHQAALAAVDGADPAAILDPVDRFKEQVLGAIDSVDAAALTDALGSISEAVSAVSLPAMRTGAGDRVRALSSRLDQLDLTGLHGQVDAMRTATLGALDSIGALPDPMAEQRRLQLREVVDRMDPLSLFASSLSRLGALRNQVGTLATRIEEELDADGALAEPMALVGERIQDVTTGLDSGVADVKQTLRDLITGGLEATGVEEIRSLHAQLRETLVGLGPDAIEAAVDEILAPVRGTIDNLPEPGTLFDAVAARLQELRARLTGEVRDTVDALRDQVQAIVDGALAVLDPIDVDAVIASLDAAYADILGLRDRLLAAIAALSDAVDAPYETVVGLIDELNPFEILGPVLDGAYQEILGKVEGLDLQEIFAPLLEAIGSLRDELLEGVRRVGDSFGTFQSTSASVSA